MLAYNLSKAFNITSIAAFTKADYPEGADALLEV